ncbi:MAG: ATPase domain-containing protein [Candidatus Diapherotrites archaeon]|nr:ATPase domain-containing protein [Candidatus Diapherotrites archaeon]
MQRSKTGIQGLDKALNGGFPEGNLVLLSGGAGTGKSTISLQYLVNGATLYGEKGLYISTEQSEEELQKSASQFGWNLVDLENRNLLRIIFFKVLEEDHFLTKIEELVKTFQPKRIVIDSMTTLTDSLMLGELQKDKAFSMINIVDTVSPIQRTEQIVTKIILYNVLNKFKEFGTTVIFTSELHEGDVGFSTDGVSEFIVDGVVTLHFLEGTKFRTLKVRKMRYTDHGFHTLDYIITSKGIELQESTDLVNKL